MFTTRPPDFYSSDIMLCDPLACYVKSISCDFTFCFISYRENRNDDDDDDNDNDNDASKAKDSVSSYHYCGPHFTYVTS